jgi:FAD/FMN-containing dehydrogenase
MTTDTTSKTGPSGRIAVPGFRGELIEPGDPGYDAARAVYNGAIDRRPRIIARCVDAADVIAAVKAARARDLTIAVRGGGHNAGGLGVWDDALVVDLSAMRAVHVDPAERIVRVEGGAVWGDVDHATHPFGLAVPSGFISSTGVGGLTLGGGIGYLARQFGLTIDSLVAADVVLADGRMVTADAERHPDLFWALRGGGGNFGVVTSFSFRGHPVRNVVAGPMMFDATRGDEVMRAWDRLLAEAPENLNGWFGFLAVPTADDFPADLHGRTVAAIMWCFNGPAADAAELLAPMRALDPLLDGVGEVPWPALQSVFDPLFPAGLQWYWKADFVDELTDDAVAIHVEHGRKLPTPQSTMHLYPVGGAVQRVGAQQTAYAHRQARYAQVIVGVDPEPANLDRMTGWARAYHDALHPHSAGGAYVNMMMDDEGPDRVRASYRGNFTRLVEVKRRYDPDNAFHVNQNIAPDAART